jgi:uncharacterized protein YndB with AHSA1/START domain
MNLPPLRRQVVVPAGPEVAFDVFTQRIGDWWPLDRFSVHGEKATTAFRDGRLVETGPGGDEAVWGTVLDWVPPRRLRLTWHPGRDADRASEVEVSPGWPGRSNTAGSAGIRRSWRCCGSGGC